MKLTKYFIITVCIFCMAGCATMAYNSAKSTDTIDAYQGFIRQYPNNEYTSVAESRIVALNFEKAKKENTIPAYRAFIDKYSGSKQASEAESRIEKLSFESAKKENTIPAYQAFADKYPDSEYLSEAKSRIEALYFQQAEKENTAEVYKKFILQNPNSKFRAKAEKRIKEIEAFNKANSVGSFTAYVTYAKIYPDSCCAEAALKKMNQISSQVTEAIRQRNVASVKSLLNKHPGMPLLMDGMKRSLLATVAKCGRETDVDSAKSSGIKLLGFLMEIHKPFPEKQERKCAQISKILISKGADVNARAKNGNTPLLNASIYGHTIIAKVLLKNGAKTDVCTGNMCILTWTSFLGQKKMLKLLLANGANVNPNGIPPLHMVSNAEIALILIKHGADVNAIWKRREPLCSAKRSFNSKVVEVLKKNGGRCSDYSIY